MADGITSKGETQILLRTVDNEVQKPVQGEVFCGNIPKWLNGKFVRNGPGGPDAYGEGECKHIFDAPGLLHKFDISNSQAFYSNRYIRTKSYKRNIDAKRLVVGEFGTYPTPDPCQQIFKKVSALFSFEVDQLATDNANVSIQPLGNEVYALAETPFAHQIDLDNLETLNNVNVHKDLGFIHQASHFHIEASRNKVYCLGEKVSPRYGLHYTIVEISTSDQPKENKAKSKSPWSSAKVVARVKTRWPLSLCYMHSYCITPNYFILIEQPLAVSLVAIPYNLFS